MTTWIIPVIAEDGRRLFVSLHARTRLGALLAFYFKPHVAGDLPIKYRRAGPPQPYDVWVAAGAK